MKIRCQNSFKLITGVALLFCFNSSQSYAQGPPQGLPNTGVTIQLPSLRVFSVQTVVSVPDGGTTLLGGNSTYAAGRSSRGVPGLSSVPFLNRPFRNQGIGYDSSTSSATVSAKIIILDELEAEVMREAERRSAVRRSTDPNGEAAVRNKADFLSRNIARNANRRR